MNNELNKENPRSQEQGLLNRIRGKCTHIAWVT